MSAEFDQFQAVFFNQRKNTGHDGMQFTDGELMLSGMDPMRLNTGNARKDCRIEGGAFMQSELDNLVSAHGGDKFPRRAHGDDASAIHDGDAMQRRSASSI